MRIETPEFLLDPAIPRQGYPTIGALYAALEAAISANADAIRAAVKAGGAGNQVIDNIGAATIASTAADPVALMLAALRQIVDQGEGSRSRTLRADGGSEAEESHYCKFAELFYGRQFQVPADAPPLTRDNEPSFFKGAPIPPPAVRNLLTPPADGYAKILALDPAAADVSKTLDAFDEAYSGMMANLDDAWNGPAAVWWPTLGQGVSAMGKLRVLGYFNIMKFQIPPAAVAQLKSLYPDDFEMFQTHANLDAPVFYAPRFRNLNAAAASGGT